MSASGALSGEQFNYRGTHQPGAGTSPLHALDGTFPDVYDRPLDYTHESGSRADNEAVSAVRAVRGKPNATVPIYRAAPAGVTHINPGDWVTTSKTYAQSHARHPTDPAQDMPVHSAHVPAAHVRDAQNDILEFGYHGPAPVAVKTAQPPKKGWPDA